MVSHRFCLTTNFSLLFIATRRQLIVKRRYSAFKKFPQKKRPVSLRSVLPGIGESKRELNYSLAEGLAWKVFITLSLLSMNVSVEILVFVVILCFAVVITQASTHFIFLGKSFGGIREYLLSEC